MLLQMAVPAGRPASLSAAVPTWGPPAAIGPEKEDLQGPTKLDPCMGGAGMGGGPLRRSPGHL